MANITITMTQQDSYNDGWNNAYVRIYDSGGAEVAAHTLEGGGSGSDVFELPNNADYTWTFSGGAWISEAKFEMTDADGTVLASAEGAAWVAGGVPNGGTATGSFTLGVPVESEFLSTHSSELGEFSALSGQITLPATYSINIWVKNVTLPGQEWSNLYQQISGYNYILDANYGAIGAGTGPTRLAVSAADPLLVADTFHLVTCVFDGTTIEYYVNGVSIGSTTPGGAAPTVIDVVNGPGGQDFAAVVKDLRLYAMVATADQVLASYSTEGKFANPDYDGGDGDSAYTISYLSSSTESPVGDVGFEKGDKPGFFLYSGQDYDVWFMVGGSWSQFQASPYQGGMGFAWPDNATRCYVEMSVAGQAGHMFERDLSPGYFCDSDDADSSLDKFKSSGLTLDVTEFSVNVVGTTPIDLSTASSFVQVIEGGALSTAYAVTTGASTVLTPPEGKDGVQILVRVFN